MSEQNDVPPDRDPREGDRGRPGHAAHNEHRAVAREVVARAAHELRNPLTGLQLNLARLRREAAEPGIREGLGDTLEGVDKIARTLSGLVETYAFPGEVEDIALGEHLADVAAAARAELPAAIVVEHSVSGAPVGTAPAGAFHLAVLGLVRNAAAVMPDGGCVGLHGSRAGPWARVEICDQGPGFPDELLGSADRIARTLARRPSFGLAIARRVMTDAGGRMEVQNRARGGCVVLDLPVPDPAE